MEKYTLSLVNLFQGFDSVSLLSQIFLEDIILESNLQQRRKDEKLVILLDQFCDMALKYLQIFLEHNHVQRIIGKYFLKNFNLIILTVMSSIDFVTCTKPT